MLNKPEVIRLKKVNIAVVGAGDWGKNIIRNFNKVANLVAICDVNLSLAKRIASEYGIKNLSWQELLEYEELDAIAITNNRSHYELAKAALNANKHIFVEKPLAYNSSQAQELCDLAVKKNKKIMVGHLLNYHPAFIKLKQLCDQNVLGKIHYIYSNRLALGKFMPGEDVILNFASHDISMLLTLVGGFKILTTLADSFLIKNTIDQAILKLKFGENSYGHIFVSWFHPIKERKLVVIGSKATIVFDDLLDWPEKLCLYHRSINYTSDLVVLKNLPHEFISIENQVEPLLNETQHFIDCVQNNLTPKTDGLEGLEVLKIIEQINNNLTLKNNLIKI